MSDVNGWRAAATATGPADRAAAEAGVRLAYRLAGLAEPERVLWADSPRAAVATVRELTDPGPSVRDAVRTQPWAAARTAAYAALGGPRGWAAHWATTASTLWESVASLTGRIRTGLVESWPEEEATAVQQVLLDAVLGQHDAAWLVAFDGPATAVPGDGGTPGPLAGLAQVARHGGWWWPYEKVAVLSERPVELHRDEAGRLDRAEGPALAYPDGWALHSWRGMPVPAEWQSELATLTPERIRAEENAELRRVMLEYYGFDRYLADSGAKPRHKDETGTLWHIALADDEDVLMVEVVNSTPEPDGTYKVYWLRVPPGTRTAKEGVAWTFGVSAEEYRPLAQT
jgi:hypothetical protein